MNIQDFIEQIVDLSNDYGEDCEFIVRVTPEGDVKAVHSVHYDEELAAIIIEFEK